MRNRAKSSLRSVFSLKYETCLGGIFKTHGHACVHLSGPPGKHTNWIPGSVIYLYSNTG